jgi:hypothetical protein
MGVNPFDGMPAEQSLSSPSALHLAVFWAFAGSSCCQYSIPGGKSINGTHRCDQHGNCTVMGVSQKGGESCGDTVVTEF